MAPKRSRKVKPVIGAKRPKRDSKAQGQSRAQAQKPQAKKTRGGGAKKNGLTDMAAKSQAGISTPSKLRSKSNGANDDVILDPAQLFDSQNRSFLADIQAGLLKNENSNKVITMKMLKQVNISSILNEDSFASLPHEYQARLAQLLPSEDVDPATGAISPSALKNEYFNQACSKWSARLAAGEFKVRK